jgi:hypothetical protein
MAASGPGLGDVLDLSFTGWRPRSIQGGNAVFGAAGRRGFEADPEMIDLLRSTRSPGPFAEQREYLGDPMDRMFNTAIGEQAVNAVGNESRTLAALQRLSVEIMAETLRATHQVGDASRLLVMPGEEDGRPPVLMLMSPKVADVRESRIISGELELSLSLMQKALREVADPEEQTPEGFAFREVLRGGPAAIAEIFLISQPEIVLTRRPRMIPLCVSVPHIKIKAGSQTSTAGVLCRDQEGEIGVTGCYHGTGPKGTNVSVGSHGGYVKHVSELQDIVFIPLGYGFKQAPKAGLGGVLEDREPARADHVYFDGATNQNCRTRIFGTDMGLLRARPTMQLKLQTNPDTDEGDSGSALIDQSDRVLGFAFERTDYNDFPQFTDWIWAANALRALRLTPL